MAESEVRLPKRSGLRSVGTTACIVMGLFLLSVVVSACSDRLAEAQMAENRGDLEGAVQQYEEYLEEEPNDLTALRGLAVDLYLKGDYDGALPVQEKVVALDPEDVQTRVELGFNYLNHQEQPGKATDILREAVALDATAKHLTFLAQAEIVFGMTDEAKTVLHRAVSADPQYEHAYVVLISLLEGQGQTDEAAEIRRAAESAGVELDE